MVQRERVCLRVPVTLRHYDASLVSLSLSLFSRHLHCCPFAPGPGDVRRPAFVTPGRANESRENGRHRSAGIVAKDLNDHPAKRIAPTDFSGPIETRGCGL